MRHLILFIFLAFAFSMSAEAEPMSVRCDGQSYEERQPYFMTFDIEKGRAVFENVGGNIVTGEITSANDEELELSLRGSGGRILVSFNRKRSVMIWPGLPAGELRRFLLRHTCTKVADRTVLSMFYQPEQFDPKRRDPIDAFSLSCPAKTVRFYFITMDRVTKSVVIELERFSGIVSGNIMSVDDGIIKFTFGSGPSDLHDAVWDERKRSLTLVGIPGDASKPDLIQEGIVTKPRSIMEPYEDLVRWQ